jgi:hypothetical protein
MIQILIFITDLMTKNRRLLIWSKIQETKMVRMSKGIMKLMIWNAKNLNALRAFLRFNYAIERSTCNILNCTQRYYSKLIFLDLSNQLR